MSEQHNHDNSESSQRPTKREMSRRQFLTYTLGGAGAMMAVGPVLPMLRFAVDPLLQKKAAVGWTKVVEESQVTTTPTTFKFRVHQIDGWYESDPQMAAFIARDDKGEIFALSPICKHLGCLIDWGTDPQKPDEYNCPCHGAHYTKDGKNIVVAPSPLDEYEVMTQNGYVYLGKIKKNSRV